MGLRAGDSTANFYEDIRIDWAREVFGGFEGKTVLEIGPLEAAQTYMMCRLGCQSVTAIESSPRAFLKCLIIKEIFNLTPAHFHLGDAVEYLRHSTDTFDIAVATGVLYHMRDPIEFLELVARKSNRLLLATHYYDFEALDRLGLERLHFKQRRLTMKARGETFTGYRHSYTNVDHPLFQGGTHDYSCWLPRDEIERAIRLFGFTNIRYNLEEKTSPHGPCFAVCASR